MKKFKKLLSLIIVYILLFYSLNNNVYASPNITTENPVKVGVFISNLNDPFLSSVTKNLEDIQKENEKNVQFTFFDAKNNQGIQNESIDASLNGEFDLLVINLVSRDLSQVEGILNEVTQKNIPFVIYLSTSPEITNFIKNYNRAVIMSTDNELAGVLQGKILVDAWNANKQIIDRNKDNIMQYVVLQGAPNSPPAIARTKYSIQAINEAGIKTQQLSSVVCNWEKECAKTAIDSIFLVSGSKVEAIIANNDAMAIGAIETLQKYGFNKGGNSKYIPVVGVDALPEAQELIKQGIMTGTVRQDPREHANAIYTIGMNLLSGVEPLKGTNYKFDETGTTIKLPYYEYVK